MAFPRTYLKSNHNRNKKKGNPPGEDATMFVNNKKLTRDLAKAVRYKVGKKQAHNHLTSHEGWIDTQFDEVDWDRLHSVM